MKVAFHAKHETQQIIETRLAGDYVYRGLDKQAQMLQERTLPQIIHSILLYDFFTKLYKTSV